MTFYLREFICVLLFMIFTMASVSAEVLSSHVVINLPSRMLELYSGNTLIKEYSVAVGKPSTQTPLGEFSIYDKEVNPTWISPHDGVEVESGPNNPLGYRWMEFFPLYGVHGTNVPSSIGQAASNGCIRMKEDDVEELFDTLPMGTPIKITYNRIHIRIDTQGLATMVVYPDIYSNKTVALADIKNKLVDAGLNGIANEDFLLNMIQESSGKWVTLGTIHKMKVNNQIVKEWAVSFGDDMYVPVWPVSRILGCDLVWDAKNQQVSQNKHVVNGIVKGNVIYIKEENIPQLFEGENPFTVTIFDDEQQMGIDITG